MTRKLSRRNRRSVKRVSRRNRRSKNMRGGNKIRNKIIYKGCAETDCSDKQAGATRTEDWSDCMSDCIERKSRE